MKGVTNGYSFFYGLNFELKKPFVILRNELRNYLHLWNFIIKRVKWH